MDYMSLFLKRFLIWRLFDRDTNQYIAEQYQYQYQY